MQYTNVTEVDAPYQTNTQSINQIDVHAFVIDNMIDRNRKWKTNHVKELIPRFRFKILKASFQTQFILLKYDEKAKQMNGAGVKKAC